MAEGQRDFKISPDEVTKLQDALKKPEFRKMFFEYAQEISDPENKKKYEEELVALEKQRGVDMKYIHPIAGFVMKSFLLPEGTRKIFINVCHSDMVSVATSSPGQSRNARKRKKGQQWSIPYSVTPPREDLDKSNNRCTVVDVVFNTKTFQKGKDEPRFKKMLIDTVFSGLEDQLKLKIDRMKVIYLKMPYKGVPVPSVIRKRMDSKEEEVPASPLLDIPYPPLKEEQDAKSYKHQQKKKEKAKLPTQPEYTVIHRGEFSMQDFTNNRESTRVKRPKELVVTVKLPGVESAAAVELDIFEKKIVIQCENPVYKLDLPLDYPIDEEKGKAKFDKAKKSLTITLPVLPLTTTLPQQHPQANPHVTDLSNGDRSNDGVLVDDRSDFTESNPKHYEGGSTGKEDESLDVHLEQDGRDCIDITLTDSEENLKENSAERIHLNGNLEMDEHNSQPEQDSLNEIFGPSDESHDQETLLTTVKPEMKKDWLLSRGEWVCPPFSYRQEEAVIVFCLHTSEVKENSLVKYFDDHSVQLTYTTLNKEKFSFYVSFPETCSLDVDDCSLDISEENVVVLLKKDPPASSADLWERFYVGLNPNQTMEKLFLTSSNVQSVIEKLEDLPDPWKKDIWSDSATASATLMKEQNRLDIVISDPKRDTTDRAQSTTDSGHFNGELISENCSSSPIASQFPDPNRVSSSSEITDATSKAVKGVSSVNSNSEPVLRVEEDGSIFIRGDKNYMKDRDTVVSALGGEEPGKEDTSLNTGTNIKLSNKLLYSLD